MNTDQSESPLWLSKARKAWKDPITRPRDTRWTGFWVEKFLVYLRRRNQGTLPKNSPDSRVLDSFFRFIAENWELEDWKLNQAKGGGKREQRLDPFG